MLKAARVAAIGVTALLLVARMGAAAPTGPVYPAPGGTSFSTIGSSLIDSNGVTRVYSGFDSSQWSQLYWNITDAYVGSVSFGTSVSGPNLSGFGLSGNEIVWYPVTALTISGPFGTQSTPVRLVTRFLTAGGAPIPNSGIAVTGMFAGMPIVSLDISPASLAAWGGGFQVQQFFQTSAGGTVANWNNYWHGDMLLSGTNAGFYYEAPVPDPASTLLLFGAAVTGIAAARRRWSR